MSFLPGTVFFILHQYFPDTLSFLGLFVPILNGAKLSFTAYRGHLVFGDPPELGVDGEVLSGSQLLKEGVKLGAVTQVTPGLVHVLQDTEIQDIFFLIQLLNLYSICRTSVP